MTDADGQDRERANLARHLNQSHADSVALVATALGGTSASEAEIIRLTDDHVDISTSRGPDGSGEPDVRVALPGQPGEPLRQRFARLVQQARQATPDAPVTSLERMLAGHDSPVGD